MKEVVLFIADRNINLPIQLLSQSGYFLLECQNLKELLEMANTAAVNAIILKEQDLVSEQVKDFEELKVLTLQFRVALIILTSEKETFKKPISSLFNLSKCISRKNREEIFFAEIKASIRGHHIQQEAIKQKLDAIKAIVTTVKHEINNPLTVAKGRTCRIQKEFKDSLPPKAQKQLDQVYTAIEKIELVVRTLGTIRDQLPLTLYSGSTDMLDLKKLKKMTKNK